MSYKCQICGEEYNYQDEMVFYDCNGNDSDLREECVQDPDNVVYVICGTCEENLENLDDDMLKLLKRFCNK